MKAKYKVAGMTCDGCANALKRAIAIVAPHATVEVSVASGTATVDGADSGEVAKAVQQAGFDFLGQVDA